MANFNSSNKLKALNFLLFTLFIFSLCAAANFLSSRYFCRIYLSSDHKFALDRNSKRILTDLNSDVQIFVLLEKTQEYAEAFDTIKNDMRRLLSEYANSIAKNKLEAEIVNVAENSKKYSDLCQKFGILPTNCVLIAANGRVKVLTIDHFYKAENGKIVAFQGEKAISSALLDLSLNKKHVIYFSSGHGEHDIESTSPCHGLSALKRLSEQNGFDVRSLDLCESKAIPEDAELIIIAGAKEGFFGFELEIFRDFIDTRDGKILVAIDIPPIKSFKEFLGDYGILTGNTPLSPTNTKTLNYEENTVIKRFAPHVINNKLIDFKVPIVCGTIIRTCRAPWSSEDSTVEISELLQTDDDFSDEIDTGAAIIAAISERKKFNANEITKNAGKILVIGNGDFMTNSKIQSLGNRLFWAGICEYMLNRKDVLKFEDIKIENYRLAIPRNKISKIAWKLGYIAISYLVLGACVAFLRRK